MKKLEPYVDAATTLFLNKLNNMAGKEMNMTKWAQLYAFGEFYLLLYLFLHHGFRSNHMSYKTSLEK
jgi:hypothetical protein